MKEFLEKNKKEILIIFGTILVYIIIAFKTNIITKMISSNDAFIRIVLPGFFSAILFAITKQRLFYTLIFGIAVSVLFTIMMSGSFTLMALPGFISALLSAVIWKNLKKSLIIGVITSIVLFIGFWVLLLLGFLGSIGHI